MPPRNNTAVEISLIPNTGHHYHFIPCEKLPRAFNLPIQQLAENEKEGWELGRNAEDNKDIAWIRYRPGSKNGIAGLWIAIETNVGTIHRGSVIGKAQTPIQQLPQGIDENDKSTWKASPYAYDSVSSLTSEVGNAGGSYFIELKIKDPNKDFDYDLPADVEQDVWLPDTLILNIKWVEPAGSLDVDLIVDFGNTRTVTLAIERVSELSKKQDSLASICHPIYSLRRGCEYPTTHEEKAQLEKIVDSWFLLQEPMFSNWDFQPAKSSIRVDSKKAKAKERKEKELRYKVDSLYKRAFSREFVVKFPTAENTAQKVGNFIRTSILNKKPDPPQYFQTIRKPQMFVEVSPALMGKEARELLQSTDTSLGLNTSLSSPKRYLWDQEKIENVGGQIAWGLNKNPWNELAHKGMNPKLEGEICRYMYDDGHYWEIDNPPTKATSTEAINAIPYNPLYPRSCAMVWSALSIIENAYRQITSEGWRKNHLPLVVRRLSTINVTFPSGWIAQEKEYYRQAWQEAINIFTLTHMETTQLIRETKDSYSGGRPELFLDLDEAVASQIPFIYSEISRLNGNANQWIALYGRKDGDSGMDFRDNRIRVMTVDIGGGTMDSTIIEYRNLLEEKMVDLRYKILFRDCSTFAGDTAMYTIINRVLLPALITKRTTSQELIDVFVHELSKTKSEMGDRSKWNRIITNFFVPVVQQWLTDMAKNATENEQGDIVYKTPTPLALEECGAEPEAIKDFNDFMKQALIHAHIDMSTDEINSMDLVKSDDRFSYSPELIDECIVTALKNGIIPLGSFVAAYDVDVVTLSGKISEMPCVAKLLRQYLPIREQRIIPMKNYLAGNWYPTAVRGRIHDAKTVTVVGAAYYAAQKNNLLGTWQINKEDPEDVYSDETTQQANKNYWGVLPSDESAGFATIILNRDEESNDKHSFNLANGSTIFGSPVNITSRIGRMKYMSEQSIPEMQYEIVWVGEGPQPKHVMAATFQRKNLQDDDDIELVAIEATNDSDYDKVNTKNVKLRLKTMSPRGFWKEECEFEINNNDLNI